MAIQEMVKIQMEALKEEFESKGQKLESRLKHLEEMSLKGFKF